MNFNIRLIAVVWRIRYRALIFSLVRGFELSWWKRAKSWILRALPNLLYFTYTIFTSHAISRKLLGLMDIHMSRKLFLLSTLSVQSQNACFIYFIGFQVIASQLRLNRPRIWNNYRRCAFLIIKFKGRSSVRLNTQFEILYW